MSLFDEYSPPTHPVQKLDKQKKQDYLNLIAFIANADGKYHSTETDMLSGLSDKIGLTGEHVEDAVNIVKRRDKAVLEASLLTWAHHDLRYVLFFDICRIVAADGTICEREKRYLDDFARELNIGDAYEGLQEMARALKCYGVGNTKQNFDSIIVKTGLRLEDFAFIRDEFSDGAASGSEAAEPQTSAVETRNEVTNTYRDKSLANSVIRECQDNILSHLSLLRNILEKCRPKGNGKYALASDEEIEQYQQQIEEEQAKVQQLRMTLAVIGPMKAGKSTLINAIVGAEVLPSRSGAMTTMPTLITHVDGCKEPVLRFPKPEPFNRVIKAISEKTACKSVYAGDAEGTDYNDTLNRIRSKELTDIKQEYRGEAHIASFMTDLNDLVRISQLPDFELPSPLEHYSQIDDFPEIEVEFVSLTNRVNGSLGKLTLVDTPGPNEAGQGHLKGVVKKQLQQAAAIVVVVAPTQKDGEAFAEIRSWVHNARVHNGVPLYIFLNKFDEMRKAERKTENVALLCRSLFPDIPLEDGRVLTVEGSAFPTCAFPALLANKAIRYLENEGKLPHPNNNSWVLDFAEKVFGQLLADEKIKEGNLKEFRAGSDNLWAQSLMESPLNCVISASLYRAAPLCLDSAVEKIVSTGKFFQDQAKGQRNSLAQSIDTLQHTIKTMNSNLAELKKAQEKLQSIAQSVVRRIGNELIRPLDAILQNAGNIIKDTAKLKGQELDDVEKKKVRKNEFIFSGILWNRNSPSKSEKLKAVFTGDEVLEFSSKDDADSFRSDLQGVVNKDVGKALQKTVDDLEPIISKEQERLSHEIDLQINPIVKKIGDETKETFDIDLSPPKVDLPRMHLDLDIISCINVDKDSVRKSYTERRWYTAWVLKHVVEYYDDVYKIDPRIVRKNIQQMLQGKIEDLKESVNTFVADQFDGMMQEYFRGLAETVSQVRSIAEMGIEAKKLDRSESQKAQIQWQNTEEELTDFHDSVSYTKNKLKQAEG